VLLALVQRIQRSVPLGLGPYLLGDVQLDGRIVDGFAGRVFDGKYGLGLWTNFLNVNNWMKK